VEGLRSAISEHWRGRASKTARSKAEPWNEGKGRALERVANKGRLKSLEEFAKEGWRTAHFSDRFRRLKIVAGVVLAASP
jgi:hypothetical protein